MVSQSIWLIVFSLYRTRIVTLNRRQEHITPMLRSLHWLPVHCSIIFKILLFTYKALNGLAPDYIRDLLRFNISDRKVRSSNNRLLDEPRANLKTYGERNFSVAAPRFWNKLSLQIRVSSSEAVFKANRLIFLSVHLICSSYFFICSLIVLYSVFNS